MRARPWILPALASLLAACGATGDGSIGDTEAATTDGDTTAATDTAVDTDTAGSTGTDTADTEVDTDTATTDTSSVAEATLVRGEFTIPAGAVVDAFVFSAEGEPPPFSTVGADVIVRVLDLTHPERDQTSLCSGNHPLNGCATVDYGAFGDTYDNHLIVAGEGGPIALHLFKDRTIQFGPEPLPPDEWDHVSLGQVAQEWQGTLMGEITGTSWEFQMAFSNIDANAPDGLMGPTTVEVEVIVLAP